MRKSHIALSLTCMFVYFFAPISVISLMYSFFLCKLQENFNLKKPKMKKEVMTKNN